MPHYKITIEYDGTGLVGWQVQPGELSVQKYIQDAIKKLSGEDVIVFCAGRTDAGVHALAQVAHFSLEKDMPAHNVHKGINFYLETEQVSILAADIVNEDFHARFSATGRSYIYKIINRTSYLTVDAKYAWWVRHPLDLDAMRKAADYLIGSHDFTSFRASECQAKSPVKSIDEIALTKEGERVFLSISARSFLHHMVRNITGTLVLVGQGRWTPEQVKEALEAKSRCAAGPTAPPHGLYLTEVRY